MIDGITDGIFRIAISLEDDRVFAYPANDPINYVFTFQINNGHIDRFIQFIESAGFVFSEHREFSDGESLDYRREVQGRNDWNIGDYPNAIRVEVHDKQ